MGVCSIQFVLSSDVNGSGVGFNKSSFSKVVSHGMSLGG